MTEKFTLSATVSYGDVDRTEVLLLPGWFKLLQEAAILHANQFDTGTKAMTERGESWVLNRMAVGMTRYPRFEEALRIVTWSRGIRGFKGYREFRVFDAANEQILAGSSLWLYVNVRSKAIVRVPADVAAGFPVCSEGPFLDDIDRLESPDPAADAHTVAVTLRFSDFDANEHVNNTAYLDLLQTALARTGANPRPCSVRIRFAKSIPAGAESVSVRVAPAAGRALFSIEDLGTTFASGEIA